MASTRHAQLNSLIGQMRDDVQRINSAINKCGYITPESQKQASDAAHAILNKLMTYERLNAPVEGSLGGDRSDG